MSRELRAMIIHTIKQLMVEKLILETRNSWLKAYGFVMGQHLITKSIAMTNNQILQADMLDILFEHRNKLYGAYALRKTYSNRLGKALGIALVIALAFIIFSFMK